MRRFALLVASLLWASPVWAATTYFSDDCNDTGSTTLASHTPDTGTSWTKIASTGGAPNMMVSSGGTSCGGQSTSASSGALYTADGTYSTANYYVQVTAANWSGTGTETITIGCRVVAGVDGYFAVIHDDSQDPDVRLYRSDDSVTTSLGTANIATATTDVYKLECNGSSITLKRNDVAVIGPVTDATYSAAGEAALGAGDILDLAAITGMLSASTMSIDDFTVTSIDTRRAIAPIMLQ